MHDQLLHAAKPSLAYAKLVATPTDTSWSQAYNAGSLFACLSLTKNRSDDEGSHLVSLHAIGKELLNILESEFFTLEEKNINTIKKAIAASIEHVPPTVSVNLSLALFKDTILNIFIAGEGKIIMKRGGKIGTLLEGTPSGERTIVAASGVLSNNDTITLETGQFAHDIADEAIASALDLALPNDIAEALSPQIHEQDDGGQAAVIIVYHGIAHEAEKEPETLAEAIADDEKEEQKVIEELHAPEEEGDPFSAPEITQQPHKPHIPPIPHVQMPHLKLPQLSNKRKLFLSVAVLLAGLLIAGIFFTRQRDLQSKQQQLFTTVYEPAKKTYEEGLELKSLNANLSRDDFQKAEKLLKDNLDKFTKGSDEERQLSALLSKVEEELKGQGEEPADAKPAKQAAADASPLLHAEKNNPDGLAFGNDGSIVYFVTAEAVMKGKTKAITNDKDWENPQAIVPYQGNIYILDQKNGVLKYTAGGTGYGKSSYFKKSPDLSTATGMAIDGSVWILLSDGSIYKYTKGESDGFKVKGLDKPFSHPTKLFTNIDTESIYVLDKGNSRVVKLAKDGNFKAQYTSSTLKQAKDFDVSEEDKKIYFLANDNLFEIPL